MGRTDGKSLKKQMKDHANSKPKKKKSPGDYKGNFNNITPTGSTDLDLAISGGAIRGGGIPSGILFEAFGPNSSGKTVLLMEIGGYVQRDGGDYLFNDPEARLDKGYAKQFDFNISKDKVHEPDTVTEVFKIIRKWEPKGNAAVNGIFTDSLAALSTNLEMDNEEGDKYGMRRAKEFSEGLRKTCRIIKQKNYLMGCSNQIRENSNLQGEKFTVPGGKAVGFYSSLRLRFFSPEKVKSKEKTIGSKKVVKVIGTKVKVEVYKNSCDIAYRTAIIYLINGYGIDDVRANLQYIKDYTKETQYTINGRKINVSMDKAIQKIEKDNLEDELKEQVIDLWEEIEAKFKIERKKKKR
jgi:recombination protein RecA